MPSGRWGRAGVKPEEQRLGLNAWGPVVSLNLPVTLRVGQDVTSLCLSFFIREMGLVIALTSQAREAVEVQARVPGRSACSQMSLLRGASGSRGRRARRWAGLV